MCDNPGGGWLWIVDMKTGDTRRRERCEYDIVDCRGTCMKEAADEERESKLGKPSWPLWTEERKPEIDP